MRPLWLALLIMASVLSAAQPVAQGAPPTRLANAGELRSLLDAQRGKVVVLNFWATWCVPCLREIPVLLTVSENLAPRGVVLLAIAMDEPQALAQVEPFRLKYFPRLNSWLRNEPDMDDIASVVDQAWNEILPTSYIIGRDGKLRTKIQGARSEAQFRAAIQAALRD